jgi:hypothetical protein
LRIIQVLLKDLGPPLVTAATHAARKDGRRKAREHGRRVAVPPLVGFAPVLLHPLAQGAALAVMPWRIVEDRGRRVLTRAEALGGGETPVATAEALSLRL